MSGAVVTCSVVGIQIGVANHNAIAGLGAGLGLAFITALGLYVTDRRASRRVASVSIEHHSLDALLDLSCLPGDWPLRARDTLGASAAQAPGMSVTLKAENGYLIVSKRKTALTGKFPFSLRIALQAISAVEVGGPVTLTGSSLTFKVSPTEELRVYLQADEAATERAASSFRDLIDRARLSTWGTSLPSSGSIEITSPAPKPLTPPARAALLMMACLLPWAIATVGIRGGPFAGGMALALLLLALILRSKRPLSMTRILGIGLALTAVAFVVDAVRTHESLRLIGAASAAIPAVWMIGFGGSQPTNTPGSWRATERHDVQVTRRIAGPVLILCLFAAVGIKLDWPPFNRIFTTNRVIHVGQPQPIPSALYLTGDTTVITPAQANDVVAAMWPVREEALAHDDIATTDTIESGLAKEADDAASVDDQLRRLQSRRTVRHYSAIRVVVPRQTSYPASFLAEVATTVYGAVPEEHTPAGTPFIELLVMQRTEPTQPWRVVLTGGFTIGLQLIPVTLRPVPNDGGYARPPTRPGWVDPALVHRALADYWQHWKDLRTAPEPTSFVPGFWTTQRGQVIAQHPQDGIDPGCGCRVHVTYSADTLRDGLFQFTVEGYGAQPSDLVCSGVRIISVLTPSAGARLLQDDSRNNWGGWLRPGAYRSLTEAGLRETCILIGTEPSPGATQVNQADQGLSVIGVTEATTNVVGTR